MGLLDYLGFGSSKSFSMGAKTLPIDRQNLHANLRDRAVAVLMDKLNKKEQGVVLLQGGSPFHVHSTDMEAVFRQESYFHYLFGVAEDSYYGAIDLQSGDAYLFMPRLPETFSVWYGELPTQASVRSKYGVQYVHFVDEMPAVLADLSDRLHVLVGTNTDSGRPVLEATFEGISEFVVEKDTLFDVLTECRVVKLPEEVAIQQYCNDIGSAAHVELMRYAKAGVMEYQLESIFLHFCYFKGGCRHAPYTPIVGSGPKAAILHYGSADSPNNRELQEGELVLLDLGCEYYRYGSDITCTIPVGGKYSARQKGVYEIVLRSMRAVEAAMKPGVAWPDMHRLADRTHLEGLKALGILKGNIDEMIEANIGALFMPHGLGHLLGIDTHDVGGYGKGFPLRSERPGLKSLRLGRPLLEDMVVTVEPGLYFNPALLKPALKTNQSRFLVKSVLQSYFDFGGIRLENNVLITKTGIRTLTNVPRDIDDVERVLAGGEWPVVSAMVGKA